MSELFGAPLMGETVLDLAQSLGEGCLLGLRQAGEQIADSSLVLRQEPVEQCPALVGELDEQHSAVLRVGLAPDQPLAFERVEEARDGAPGHQELLADLAGGKGAAGA